MVIKDSFVSLSLYITDLHKQDNPTDTTPCADDELMLGVVVFDAGRNNQAALVERIVSVGRAHCRR